VSQSRGWGGTGRTSLRVDAVSQLISTAGVILEPYPYAGTQQKSAPKITMGKIISQPPTKQKLQKQPRGIPPLRLQTKGRDSGVDQYRASLVKSFL